MCIYLYITMSLFTKWNTTIMIPFTFKAYPWRSCSCLYLHCIPGVTCAGYAWLLQRTNTTYTGLQIYGANSTTQLAAGHQLSPLGLTNSKMNMPATRRSRRRMIHLLVVFLW